MASAAAVGADATGSPLREYEVAEGFSGAIKSATPPPVDDDADLEQDIDDDVGLFGDGEDDDAALDASPKVRQLDDAELDSGDDEGREDRAPRYNDYGEELQQEEVEDVVQDIELGRHPIPESSDGELYLLKVPQFLGIEPHAFSPSTFQPPTKDHHAKEASNNFSAYNTALSTIRWRHTPSSPDSPSLQSNARILRWSDGSLTLQFAHEPLKQYRIPGNPLAPPQRNPPKPTPLSSRKDRRGAAGYTAEKDSFMYLLAPQAQAMILRTTNKLTTSLLIHPPDEPNERAVEALQLALARAQGGGMGDAGLNIISISEDPELAKKKAELAEKEKERARKRREGQEARNRERQDRGGRPSGYGGRGGLTLEGLEDDELGAGVGRVRNTKPRAKPKRKPNRRGEILTDEDEEGYGAGGARGRTREDSYDNEDGFLVDDEDEDENVEESEEEEDIDEGIDLESHKTKTKSPKRNRDETNVEDLDAEGEPDDEVEAGVDDAAVARGKRRRVIDDDEE